MSPEFRVLLPYQKSDRPALELRYHLEPLTMRQARFQHRQVAVPQFDLRDYSARAVIDWLEFSVHLNRSTQFMHVRAVVAEVLGHSLWVEADDRVSDSFRIKVQDARLARVQAAVERLREAFGLRDNAQLEAVEVSVDFRPRLPSEESRHRMVGLLSRHILPSVDRLVEEHDRPRFAWGRGRKWSYIIGPMRTQIRDELVKRLTLSERTPGVDATFYIGARGGPIQWRVMDKILDRQNTHTDTREELDEAEKRARIEVTLNRGELGRLGLSSLTDLQKFSFASLQGKYFRFALPTFATSHEKVPAAIVEAMEEMRRDRFCTAGAVGLAIMDKARRKVRPEVVKTLRRMGRKAEPERRVGTGREETFVAYGELCGRVASALKKLGEREQA